MKNDKFERNDMGSRVLREVTVFWQKYGHRIVVFFREWKFFWQNMINKAVIFLYKMEKKGILLPFLAHNIV